jgi:biotin-dependent carboxylase-like uncharacterized protein
VSLEVLEPGLLTTVQDAGRPDWTHIGVPRGGACDAWSLSVANLLAGNRPDAAALEMTLVGGTFRATAPLRIGLAGADLSGHVRETGALLKPGWSHVLAAGSTIVFPGIPDAAAGARAYLALAGGIDVPTVLGSRSTALAAAFGGLDGRALRIGDIVGSTAPPGDSRVASPSVAELIWPDAEVDDPGHPIRIVAGPANGTADLVASSWRVAAGSDRVGLRLEGPPITIASESDLPSIGVVPGAIQIPAGGDPIALLADAQTTGGYPVAAVAIAADMRRLAQLRPGADVRFVEVSIREATDAIRQQAAELQRGAAILRESATWDDAWQGAGG